MKRLIALILLAPVVANATNHVCPPGDSCVLPPITSGTMTLTDEFANPENGTGSAYWTASGPGYTTSGGSGGVQGMAGGVGSIPIPYGSGGAISMADGSDQGSLGMSLTINGVPWNYNPDLSGPGGNAGAFMNAGTAKPITHAGTYSASFNLLSQFLGQPVAFADVHCTAETPCTYWNFFGACTDVLYVADYPGQPNSFMITGGKFTFRAPEPSTAALLLLGVAGLAVLGWRRNVRAP